jgi:hypothetical protein
MTDFAMRRRCVRQEIVSPRNFFSATLHRILLLVGAHSSDTGAARRELPNCNGASLQQPPRTLCASSRAPSDRRPRAMLQRRSNATRCARRRMERQVLWSQSARRFARDDGIRSDGPSRRQPIAGRSAQLLALPRVASTHGCTCARVGTLVPPGVRIAAACVLRCAIGMMKCCSVEAVCALRASPRDCANEPARALEGNARRSRR